MSESLESKIWRWAGNLFPAYRRCGAKIVYVSHNFQSVKVKLPCNWRTKNHMGITWGGSLYAALDPIYAVMLYKIFKMKYQVIDRKADIHFMKPGKHTLYAHFHISQADIDHIKMRLNHGQNIRLDYSVKLTDKLGVVHAVCNKQIQINVKPKAIAHSNAS